MKYEPRHLKPGAGCPVYPDPEMSLLAERRLRDAERVRVKKRLVLAMACRELTGRRVSLRMGYDPDYISRFLSRGEPLQTLRVTEFIARAVGVSPAWLTFGTGGMYRDVTGSVSLCERLAKAVKAAGIPRGKLEAALFYGRGNISRWCRGDAVPDLHTVCELGAYLAVDPAILAFGLPNGERAYTLPDPAEGDELFMKGPTYRLVLSHYAQSLHPGRPTGNTESDSGEGGSHAQ